MKTQSKKQSNSARRQPRKDSRTKRVNYDNTREKKFDKDIDKMRKNSGFQDCRSNDIAWYAKNTEILRASASIPFSTTVGMPSEYASVNAIPGILTLYWAPVVGSELNAPINQASRSMYSFIVHKNSRNYNYNDPDLMALVLAGANAFAALAMGIRAYGIMRKFDQRNYYTPEALVTAMGFDYADLKANLAQMWFGLNDLILRMRQIWIPNVMPVIERWFWMSSNVYCDGESVKSQYYLFVPQQLYQLDETGPDGTGLKVKLWKSGSALPKHTWAEYLQFVTEMVDALLDSEDRGIIFGDILNAYGESAIYAVNPIAADYEVTPVYDREVLTQIENATMFRSNPAAIVQDQTTLTLQQQWTPISTVSDQILPPANQILNFHQKEVPTPEQIMIATRLKAAGAVAITFTGSPNPSFQLAPVTYGTEIVVNMAIFFWQWSSGVRTLGNYYLLTNRGLTGFSMTPQQIELYNAFDWAPWIYTNQNVVDPTAAFEPVVFTTYNAIGDYDQYTYINDAVLKKLHTTAVYSEFGIPVV